VTLSPDVDVLSIQLDRTGNPSCSRIVRAIPGNRPTKVDKLSHALLFCEDDCSVCFTVVLFPLLTVTCVVVLAVAGDVFDCA